MAATAAQLEQDRLDPFGLKAKQAAHDREIEAEFAASAPAAAPGGNRTVPGHDTWSASGHRVDQPEAGAQLKAEAAEDLEEPEFEDADD